MLQKKIGRSTKGYIFDFRRDRPPAAPAADKSPAPEKAAKPAKPAAATQPEG